MIPGPNMLINMNYQIHLDQLQNNKTSKQKNNEGNFEFHWKV